MPLAAPVINSTLSSTIARFPLFLFSVFNHRSCKRCANREGRKIRREGGRNRSMFRHKKTFPECRKGQDAEMSGKRLLFRIHRRRSPGEKMVSRLPISCLTFPYFRKGWVPKEVHPFVLAHFRFSGGFPEIRNDYRPCFFSFSKGSISRFPEFWPLSIYRPWPCAGPIRWLAFRSVPKFPLNCRAPPDGPARSANVPEDPPK